MHFTINCATPLRSGPEHDLFKRYHGRLKKGYLKLTSQPSQTVIAGRRADVRIVALDERGQDFTTQEFKALCDHLQGACFVKHVYFLVGDAHGHAQAVRDDADYLVRFGAFTLPHQILPALIAEQLYRLTCMQQNHPYHK